ncbi:hypothetical protein CkaCkLH20_12267 [Colletotrichum karsti]|uniref:FAD-binding domain-containing protein n=1 Tax=Colletotrichum karsti TaxID=1095194 RepID=A0A9P6LEK2_9PEZI|nr:uncharacterized protein CkaCkLH20_12267 [Colletotrichum karsti]KAF9870181.1 hypothetical protein CkaCkLH20_12267 [Colletotrichum karsti]
MSEATSLQVAVIGGGIAGLAAASVLRRAHRVTVYERSATGAQEPGAAVGLGPNGSKMAKALGLSSDVLQAVVSNGFRTFNETGSLLKEQRLDCARVFGSEWWLVHRQDLKDALLDAATNPDLPGCPAEIVYGARATVADADAGIIRLADGSREKVDLVIAVVGQGHPQPVPANLSLYRFTCSRLDMIELLGHLPEPLNCDSGVFLSSFIASDGSNRNVVVYPCQNLQTMNFACAVPDSLLRQSTEESWTKDGDVEELIGHFQDFPQWLQQIIKSLTSVKLYQLRDADPLPTYTKGAVVLLGDAAHPMVPYQGQGANQALEDAEALRPFLQPGVSRDDVGSILKKWDELRRPRASQVQANSRIAAAKVSAEVIMQRMKFNWEYDGVKLDV